MVTVAKSSSNGVYETPEKVALQIYKTKNYDQFLFLTGNREVNDRHVQKLMTSMSEEECMSPIQVNERLEVIDGSHRLNALMRLKKPVYYYIIKGARLSTVQRLNSYTKNWTTDDYMKSYEESGNTNYKQYREFKETYKLGSSVNLLLLSGSIDRGDQEKSFKSGNFKVKDIEHAVAIAIKIEQMSKFISWYKDRSWCYALYKAIKTKGFDWDTWVHKCEYQQRLLVKCANTEQYLKLIQDLYNFKSRKEQKLMLVTLK